MAVRMDESEETDEEAKARDRRRAKQQRAKIRRDALKSPLSRATTAAANGEVEIFGKPLDQWDPEELARGKVRESDGHFHGRSPRVVDRRLVEEAIRRFQEHIREEMRVLTPTALATVQHMLEENRTDAKGRPLVPASVKLQAAQWVVEHLVGKPTQRIEADISVKLQAVLANALVQPGDEAGAELIQAIDATSWEPDAGEDEPE